MNYLNNVGSWDGEYMISETITEEDKGIQGTVIPYKPITIRNKNLKENCQ